jgi:zinc protease
MRAMRQAIASILHVCAAVMLLSWAPLASAKDSKPPSGVTRTAPWNSETSDLDSDTSIIYGRLPNGVRYAIRPNDRPQNQVLIRLGFEFGSAAEADDEQGLAHFIEHMVFNGSTHVPEGEMVKMLERLGLAFGADTNASTGYTKTQYQLDLPKADSSLIERALFLMRETASEVSFNPAAVDRERGVVLAEMRQRENFGYQSARAANALFYPDSYLSTRYPIGKKAILENVAAAKIQALYRKWYRPDRARIVIVGPVDPVAMERMIAEKFGNWKNDGPPLGTIDQCQFNSGRSSEAAIFSHPQINEGLVIQQLLPDGPRPDNFALALVQMRMQIAGSIIAERMSRRSRKQDIPYLGSNLSFAVGFCDKHALVGISMTGKDGSWQTLLPIAEQLSRQAADYGFTEHEIADQLKRQDSRFENAVKAKDTRGSAFFASALIGLDKEIISDPAYMQRLWLQLRPFMSADQVAKEFSGWYNQLNAPLIFLTTKNGDPGDASKLLSAFNASRAIPVSPPEQRDNQRFAYTNFGTPGTVVEDRMIADLGIRTLRFDNGVLLNIKKTNFEDNRIRFTLRIAGGSLHFGKAGGPLTSFMSNTYTASGLEAHDFDDLKSLLAGTTATPGISVGGNSFGSSGSVTPKDLDLQLQLMAAYSEHPGYREEAVRQFRRPLAEGYARLDATPGLAMSIASARIMTDNDPRFSLAPQATMEALNFDTLRAALGDALKTNRLEIGLVGDLDEAAVIKSVAASFGALPKRRSDVDPYTEARTTRWSAATGVHEIPHRGETNQLGWQRVWTTTDNKDTRLELSMDLLANVIRIQLLDELREKLGATYGADADSDMSSIYPGRGTFRISTSGDPKDLAAIEAAVDAIIAEIVKKPVDADIFERARKPVLESYADWRKSNGTWISYVAQAQTRTDLLDEFRYNEKLFQSLTADDIWKAAQKFLSGPAQFTFRAIPAKARQDAAIPKAP